MPHMPFGHHESKVMEKSNMAIHINYLLSHFVSANFAVWYLGHSLCNEWVFPYGCEDDYPFNFQ